MRNLGKRRQFLWTRVGATGRAATPPRVDLRSEAHGQDVAAEARCSRAAQQRLACPGARSVRDPRIGGDRSHALRLFLRQEFPADTSARGTGEAPIRWAASRAAV